MGFQEFLQQEEAAAAEKQKIARAMLSDGMDPALAAKYSGLSVEEMEAQSR